MARPRPERLVLTVLLVAAISACSCTDRSMPTVPPATTRVTTTGPAATTDAGPSTTGSATTLPAVEGADPSPRIVVFYYPWYGTPEFEGTWVHWDQAGATPPGDIGSDFYPVLGAYSSVDPAVVARHFAWLREAGVGVIASSWWGRGTSEDRAVQVLLDVGERYGIQIAFHIEPYEGRTADRVADDIAYLYERYGDHPAFFRSTETTRWSEGDQAKGLFFVWSSSVPNEQFGAVDASYWRDAMDRVHSLPDGGLVIADTPSGSWIDGGHFDGLYNYANLEQLPSFDWARELPPDAWYVPSVIPGFSAERIGYPSTDHTPREGGDTYRQQWAAALGTGIEPHMVSITSFNEWHEGTQIEPADQGVERNATEVYDDYGDLGPGGYLEMTAELAAGFLSTRWASNNVPRIRLSVETTSDWTNVVMESGGTWIQPVTVSADGAVPFSYEVGERLGLSQPVEAAEAAQSIDLVVDVGIMDFADPLRFRIERGAIGHTRVTVSRLDGEAETVLGEAYWDGGNSALVDGESGRNPFWFDVELGQP